MERQAVATGESRKVQDRYRGPLEVVSKYDNDRYLVREGLGEVDKLSMRPL